MSPPTSPVNPAIGSLESRNSSDAASHNDGGNGGEIMESLGVVLAGVTIGNATTAGTSDTNIVNDSNTGPNGANGSLFHGGNDAPSPFSSMGANTNNESSDIGWASTFSDASKSAFSGSTATSTGAPAPPPAHHHQQQQQLHHHQEATHVMKESLDLFLSQSPSQTLGNDVFKLSSSNLPGLVLPVEGELPSNGDSSPFHFSNNGGAGATGLATGANPSVFGHELRQPTTSVPSSRNRRTDSPSVTGTTASSRSASPYTNNVAGAGSIPAFRYDNSGRPTGGNAGDLLVHRQASYGGEGDRQNNNNNQVQNLTHGFNSHPNIPSLDSTVQQQRYGGQQGISGSGSGGGSSRNLFGSGLGSTSPYDQDRTFAPALSDPSATQQHLTTGSPQPHQQQQQPQPQVLYMAVPTPDGRGQVLQPVQMVQVQGKGFTYVVPQGVNQGAVGGAAMNGNMAMLPPMTNLENGTAIMGNEQRNPMGDHRSKGYALDGLKQDDYSGMPRGAAGGKFVAAGQQNDPSAALYGTTQRPPLDALLGQVRRLSRDQVGCRLVQQALDEEGPMAATLILNEGLPFWSEAMVDPFGNYLFQKILEKITSEERIMLVKTVSSRLVNASLNLHGTRSVQKIVELCAADEDSGFQSENSDESAADILTRSLFPAAARLCIDSHGNHVIQRILLKLGPRHTKFVFDAVAASVGDVARHRHGCCVIQRCLDSPISESRSHLVNRIVEKSLELMQDAYGNYVVQYVLDVCSDDDVHAVCESVIGKVNLLAIQKFSSNVMEKCLERCTDSVKEMYMQELSDTERVRELMMDPFGNYVVQRALSVATHSQAIRLVESMRPHLVSGQPGFPNGQRSGGVRNTAGGRRIMAKICRRFPNFTLSAGGSQEELFSQSKPQQRHMGNNFGAQGHHGQAAYGNPMSAGLMAGNPMAGNHMTGNPMQGGPRMQHYNDPGAVAGPHLIMNQQQAYYDSGSVNVGYFDHNFSDHPFGGQGFSQNYGGHNGFPNM